MKIVDLSLPLAHRMPVYPGDPEVDIVEIHKLDKEGWNLRQLNITTHLGTHVNVPYHMSASGKHLEEVSLEMFFGPSVIYKEGMTFSSNAGVIFRDQNIDQNIADLLIKTPPKFVGLSSEFEFDVPLEKILLEHNIISFENLANTESLPSEFVFYGVPLNIPGSDGSPVRAFAVVD